METRPLAGCLFLACIAGALLPGLPTVAVAQAPPDSAFEVQGRAVTPDSTPVPGVRIRVTGTIWTAQANSEGRFLLQLPGGRWRLVVTRIGFEPDTVEVQLEDEPYSRHLRVVLRPDPVELRGLTVRGRHEREFARRITPSTVRQVPPLVEPDVFRATVLLPSVSQPNDLKGRIHLLGGSSDETGYRLDGHPVEAPFHLLGLTGAFNVAALEDVHVRAHHLPPDMGGRLSGVVDLATAPPDSTPRHEVVGSLLSSSMTVIRPELFTEDVDLLVSGRVSYLDRVAPLLDSDIPRLGYYDGLVRVGWSPGPGWRTELLSYTTQNYFSGGEISGVEPRQPLEWGEHLVGFRVAGDLGPFQASARGSSGEAGTDLDERPAGTNLVTADRTWRSVAASIAYPARAWRFDIGGSLDYRSHRQRWIARGLTDEIFSPNMPAEYTGEDDRTVYSLFGEASAQMGSDATVSLGVRGSRHRDRWYIAPRFHAALGLGDGLELELAADRRFQFDGELEEPVEGSVSPPRFLLEEPMSAYLIGSALKIPAEVLFDGPEGTFRIQGFYKRYPDRAILRERPGGSDSDSLTLAFPQFDRIEGYGLGASVGARIRLGDRSILQGSYTFQRIRERRGEGEQPTVWDAPHTVTLFGSLEMADGWILNTALNAHSGRATTPVRARIFAPGESLGRELIARYLLGERNSIRVPAYFRLDLGIRREWIWDGVRAALSAQLINVTGRRNPVDYDWDQYFASLSGAAGGRSGRSGLPVVPSLGLELRW